jgi:hypothetical protein
MPLEMNGRMHGGDGAREDEREGRRERGRKGGREDGREGGREGGRAGLTCKCMVPGRIHRHSSLLFKSRHQASSKVYSLSPSSKRPP